MIKKNLKLLILTSVLILLPMLAGVILWDRLPAQIPSHWNVAGEIDGWVAKPFAVFGFPLLFLAIQWIGVFATSADPKKANHTGKIVRLTFWIIPLLSVLLSAITYFVAMGEKVRVEVLLPALLGLLFVVIGNYMPKCKQNYTIGIKIPWTLHSEENWNRTHRVAGWVWVVCGFAVMVSAFFHAIWLMVAAFCVMVLVPFVYSYILHRKSI